MEIKNKVTSPELSKRMKKLGWDYETERYWVITSTTTWHLSYGKPDKKWSELNEGNYLPAPDAIEIELPYRIKSNDEWYDLWIIKHTDNSWIVTYTRDAEGKTLKSYNDKSLSEAFGEMWCYLRKRGDLCQKDN